MKTDDAITKGCAVGEFTLPPDKVERLLDIIARVSEASYRRGWQQGRFSKAPTEGDYDFRYRRPLSRSDAPDIPFRMTARDRLAVEYGSELALAGLHNPRV
jgi:hypothetical protein